jgi:hypothetical protein
MNARILAAALFTAAALRSAAAGTTDGSCLEAWELENFQPASPTHGQLVHSSSYFPRATVVMLLVSS